MSIGPKFVELTADVARLRFYVENRWNQLLRGPCGVGRQLQNSMRVDEGRNSWNLLAMKKMIARTVLGRGERNLPA